MKKLLFTFITFTVLSTANASTEVVMGSACGDPLSNCAMTGLLGQVFSTTTSTFNPVAGVILVLENGSTALNTAAPEVQEAVEREELGLELNELDMAILDKLDELNI